MNNHVGQNICHSARGQSAEMTIYPRAFLSGCPNLWAWKFNGGASSTANQRFSTKRKWKDFKLTKTIWQTKPNHLINMNSKISSSSSRNLWYQDTVEQWLCARIRVLCPDTLCARICAQIWLCAQICVVRTYFQRGMDCNALRGMSSKNLLHFWKSSTFSWKFSGVSKLL